jgi:hypothetical protein
MKTFKGFLDSAELLTESTTTVSAIMKKADDLDLYPAEIGTFDGITYIYLQDVTEPHQGGGKFVSKAVEKFWSKLWDGHENTNTMSGYEVQYDDTIPDEVKKWMDNQSSFDEDDTVVRVYPSKKYYLDILKKQDLNKLKEIVSSL